MGTRARLFLADDQSLFLSGLEALLSLFGDYEIVGKARTGLDVLSIVPGMALDAILLDIGLPDRSGVEVARELRAKGVTAPILIVSNYDSRHSVVTAIKAHVQGYLLKDADADVLRRAISTILAGRRFIDERLLGCLMDELQEASEESPDTALSIARQIAAVDGGRAGADVGGGGAGVRDVGGRDAGGGGAGGANAGGTDAGGAYGLTRRELDVLRLMASGMSNDEIAHRLYLSPKTARNHTTNIFQKMGVSDRTKAVVMALAHNVVQADRASLQ